MDGPYFTFLYNIVFPRVSNCFFFLFAWFYVLISNLFPNSPPVM